MFLVASRQWMQVTPEPSRRLVGALCVSGRSRHRVGDTDYHLKSRDCTRPTGWMQGLGMSLLCVPARGGTWGGWWPLCSGCWSRGLWALVWSYRFWCWGRWAAPSALCTCAGIWAEWGDMGSPRTLVLPEDTQVGGGGSCRPWAAEGYGCTRSLCAYA